MKLVWSSQSELVNDFDRFDWRRLRMYVDQRQWCQPHISHWRQKVCLAVWEWKGNAPRWQWMVKCREPAAWWIGLDRGMHCVLCMHPVQSWVVPLQHATVASTAQTRLGACRDCRRWTPDTFPPPVAEHGMHTGWSALLPDRSPMDLI